jgi:hypothetical protein
MNIIDLFKKNKRIIIKRGLIALSAVAGLTIVSRSLFGRNHDDGFGNENEDDGFEESDEE